MSKPIKWLTELLHDEMQRRHGSAPYGWHHCALAALDELARLSALEAENERLAREIVDEHNNCARVIAQRNKDWDALMVLIAQAIGDDDDREAAEMDELGEFDPWHALRTFIATRNTALSDLARVREECEQLKAEKTAAWAGDVRLAAKFATAVPRENELDSVLSLLNWCRTHHDKGSAARTWLERVVVTALTPKEP
jgi:hypothetical protein